MIMDGVIEGILIIIAIFVVMFLLSRLDDKRCQKEKTNAKVVRDVLKSFDNNHIWKTVRMKDALLNGLTIEFVDVANNKVVLKTPDGLVEAKVNAANLKGFLVKIKAFPKSIYNYQDLYINLDMTNQDIVIDNVNYSS